MSANLSVGVTALVLLAALLHAGWNAGVKLGSDRLVVLALINGVGGAGALLLLPFVPFPAEAAWPFIMISVILHSGYYFFLIQQYRVGDLSHVYPLARGLSPLLIAFGAVLSAGETYSTVASLGLALACTGTMSLAFESGLPWRADSRPVIYAMGTAGFIAAYTLIDGSGVRVSDSALAYIVWLYALDGIPIVCFALLSRRRKFVRSLRRNWLKSLFGGGMQAGAYGIVIWAMGQGPMAQVSALRESSVVFAVLIGVWLLKEPFGTYRLAASSLVAGGLILFNSNGG